MIEWKDLIFCGRIAKGDEGDFTSMISNKKEAERAELHRTIWGIANDLRGSVDGWDFKQYVLGMLFYRYISENLDTYLSKGEIEAGNTDFSYAKLSDEEALTAKDDIVKE